MLRKGLNHSLPLSHCMATSNPSAGEQPCGTPVLAGTAQRSSRTHLTGGPWVPPGAGMGLEDSSGSALPRVSCMGRSPDPSLGLLLWVSGAQLASSPWVAVGTDRPLISPAPAQGPGWGKQEEPVTNRWQKARELPVHKTASPPRAPRCHTGHRGLARCSLVGSPRVGTLVGGAALGLAGRHQGGMGRY